MQAARERVDQLAEPTRKRWSAHTLKRLGVGLDTDGRWLIPTATGLLHYADDGRKRKLVADAGTTRELWPDPMDVAGDTLFVVEGEPDAISAAEIGLPAVALPGAGKVDDEWPARLAAGRQCVVFIADSDAVGRKRMDDMAARVSMLAEARVVDLAPDRTDGYDLGDLLCDAGPEVARLSVEQGVLLAEPVMPLAPPPERYERNGEPKRNVRERQLDQIPLRRIHWLWPPYVPLGKVTILAGAPGQGKSQLSLMVAAMVTRGELFGDIGEPRDVLILTGEDDPEDTIRPRLQALGADLSRCIMVDVSEVRGQVETIDLLTFPTEQGLLRDVLTRRKVAMIIVDPISSFMDPTLSTYRNVDVRRALGPLKGMAEQYSLAVFVVTHFNKGSDGGDALARVTDSGAYVQMARSVLFLGPDPDDDEGDRGAGKVLVVAKSNIAPPGDHAMRLELHSTHAYTDDGEAIPTSIVQVAGSTQATADDLFLSMDARDELAKAKLWVRSTLSGRWVARDDLDALAMKARISVGTLRRALKAEGKKAKERGVEYGRWYWTCLRTDALPPWEVAEARDQAHGLTDQGDQGAQIQGYGDLLKLDLEGQGAQPTVPLELGRLDTLRSCTGEGQLGQGEQGAQDLTEYRRQRDAMLGERWEDR